MLDDHLLDIAARVVTPPVLVLDEVELLDALGLVVAVILHAIELPWAGAVRAADPGALDLRREAGWWAQEAVLVIPLEGAGVLGGAVRACAVDETLRGQHAKRPDQRKLLQEWVVRRVQVHNKHLAIAVPTDGVEGQVVPAMVPIVVERRVQHVVKVHLHGGAVEGCAVVECHTCSEREAVPLSAALRVGDGPRGGKSRMNDAIVAVVHEALVDPIADEELVGPVAVRIQSPDANEETGLATRGDCNRLRPTKDLHIVHWVVKLLVPCSVSRQSPAEHSRNALAREGQVDGLLMQRAEDFVPGRLASCRIRHGQDLRNFIAQYRLGHRFWQPFERRKVGLIRGRPGRGIRVRVVWWAPGLRESHVEIAADHGLVERVLGQRPRRDTDAHRLQVCTDVILQGCKRRLPLKDDKFGSVLSA
mmetsp:Transcript_109498/g.275436  ORF Transcript_109498/g.275436 Transcript_109498/m.275436 type:complete len:419 (-) Transcript_109498:241-1497(-)